MHPTLLLFNGIIRTLNHTAAIVSALAVSDAEIIATGDDSQILTLAGPHTEKVDLRGRLVLPGFIDGHCHFGQFARSRLGIDADLASKEDVLARVAKHVRNTPAGEWITGHGWSQFECDEEFPSAADLDKVAPAHPVYLTHKSLHMGWANSFALRRGSIRSNTQEPQGGRIGRYEGGRPNGILFERAQKLVYDVIPRITSEALAAAVVDATPEVWKVGITGLHDFDGRDVFVAFQLLREQGDLGFRVVKNLPVEILDEAIGLGLRTGYGDEWLRIGHIKVFMDGALGPRTAHMMEPYEGEPNNFGLGLTDYKELEAFAKAASEEGLAMAVHAIGDQANRTVLDVYQSIRAHEKRRGIRQSVLRHRIEHVQVVQRADIGRLSDLGVIASMQPIHATSDMVMADRYWGSRCMDAYAWKSQLKAGAALVFGSDAPVEPINPLWGLHAAVTRRRDDGSPGEDGWYPEERITVDEAVRAYTIGAAYASGTENRLGSLCVGKLGDLVVLDRDIYSCDPVDIRRARVVGTIIAGEWKHRSDDLG